MFFSHESVQTSTCTHICPIIVYISRQAALPPFLLATDEQHHPPRLPIQQTASEGTFGDIVVDTDKRDFDNSWLAGPASEEDLGGGLYLSPCVLCCIFEPQVAKLYKANQGRCWGSHTYLWEAGDGHNYVTLKFYVEIN